MSENDANIAFSQSLLSENNKKWIFSEINQRENYNFIKNFKAVAEHLKNKMRGIILEKRVDNLRLWKNPVKD